MLKLSPSILSADFANLGAELARIEEAGAHYAHIDVMDGNFVPNISIGIPVVESIRKSCGLILDVHLMIDAPERYAVRFAEAGADIVCFHIEAAKDPLDIINKIHKAGKKAAIAIKPQTPAEAVLHFADAADMILIMSVEPGFGGQQFMPETLKKAAVVRNFLTSNGLDRDIEMDGGLKLSNIGAAIEAGVNVIVSGSDIFGSGDVTGRVRDYLKEFTRLDARGF